MPRTAKPATAHAAPQTDPQPARDRTARSRARDRGQVALEYLGWLPVLFLVALIGIQVGIIAYAAQQAGTAARTAARMDSLHGEGGAAAGRDAISDWLEVGFEGGPGGDRVSYTATVQIPTVLPGLLDLGSVSRSSTMPYDGGRP